MKKSLTTLDAIKKNQPWFNGAKFSLVDIAISPFFIRSAFYKEHFNLDLLEDFSNLKIWSDAILARQAVIDSKVEGFDNMLLARMADNESYLKTSAS